MEDLRLLDPGAFGSVFITGYYYAHDRGEGWFIWEENNSGVDNGGTIISPNGAPAFGRWVRLIQQAEIIPQIFGAMEATDFGVASNIQSMNDWCNTPGNQEFRKVSIPPGSYFIDGNVDFSGSIDLEISHKAYFVSHVGSTGTLSITCEYVTIRNRTDPLVAIGINLVFNPEDLDIKVNPVWFNGAPSFTALEQCSTTCGNRDFYFSTNLYIDDVETGSLTLPNLYFENGTVFDNRSTTSAITINSIEEDVRTGPIFTN